MRLVTRIEQKVDEAMSKKIILAVDTTDIQRAQEWVSATREFIGVIKIGLEFFLAHGKEGVKKVRSCAPDLEFFLDLKLHDIPNTVAGAARSIADLHPQFLTVHAAGGSAMIAAAVNELPQTRITAVTVLTSLSARDIEKLGISGNSQEIVINWAQNAVASGARAIVASPLETTALRTVLPAEISIITPGVRPSGAESGDQERVATPEEAIGWGADFVVIGRPITSGVDIKAIRSNAERISCSL